MAGLTSTQRPRRGAARGTRWVASVLTVVAVAVVAPVPDRPVFAGDAVHVAPHGKKPPKGARFRCRDGTYSFVTVASVACRRHRGVAKRL